MQYQFHAPVLGAAGLVAVGCHGRQAGHAVGREAVAGDAKGAVECGGHGIGAAAAQVEVGGQLAHVVGVAHHMQLERGLGLEQAADLLQRGLAFGLDVGLVGVEQDAVDGDLAVGVQPPADLGRSDGLHLLLARFWGDVRHEHAGALLELLLVAVGRQNVLLPCCGSA